MHEQRKKPLLLYIYRDWLKLSKPNFLISLAHLMVIHVMQEYEKILIQWVPHFIGQSRALTPWDKIIPPMPLVPQKNAYLLPFVPYY